MKLLLDEHLSPAIAKGLRSRHSNFPVITLAEWEEGRFLAATDESILEEAAIQGLTLVTYDRKTIPPLLKSWAETGHDHGGVVFVDEKTIPPSDFGGLIRALQELFQEFANEHCTNRVWFLRRQS
jgi:predicted nuclease of predicted toxin-antitoxin system